MVDEQLSNFLWDKMLENEGSSVSDDVDGWKYGTVDAKEEEVRREPRLV